LGFSSPISCCKSKFCSFSLLTEYKKEKEQNLLLQQEIGELKPKADYVDEILKFIYFSL
jgi:hypothetical protein